MFRDAAPEVTDHVSRHLIAKLEQFTRLSRADRAALEEAASARIRHFGPREDVVREGDRPHPINLILDGWAYRYKALEDGRRQITAFLLPGDICDLGMMILKQMDHSIGTLTAVTVAEIPAEIILKLTTAHPRLARAVWWYSLVEEATSREWITNLGQRTAFERLAHLFCELFLRLRAVGLTDGNSCELPLTQEQLADASGMTSVHVNRTLLSLREAGLIDLKGKILTIPDLEALQAAALFDASYLHLDHDGREFDSDAAAEQSQSDETESPLPSAGALPSR
jgi:CRP-like cAMP-binding protein